MEVSGQRHAPATLPPKITPVEIKLGLRVDLDVFRDEKFSEWIWKEKVVVCDKGVAEDSSILRCDTVPLGE